MTRLNLEGSGSGPSPVLKLRAPRAILAAVDRCARRHGKTRSRFIRDALERQLRAIGETL